MTLDALKPQQGAFEVLLLGSSQLSEWVKSYPELKIRWSHSECSLPQMMNEGVRLAKGKYIQFLEPGDRYISHYGIHFLTQQIDHQPPLIMARGISPETPSHWFFREKILELGGFDERLSFCPLQDLLYRFQTKGIQPLVCRRVIVDSRTDPSSSLRETCRILYRHFGLKEVLRWIFVQDHSQTIRRAKAFLKESFWQTKD